MCQVCKPSATHLTLFQSHQAHERIVVQPGSASPLVSTYLIHGCVELVPAAKIQWPNKAQMLFVGAPGSITICGWRSDSCVVHGHEATECTTSDLHWRTLVQTPPVRTPRDVPTHCGGRVSGGCMHVRAPTIPVDNVGEPRMTACVLPFLRSDHP